MVYGSYKYTSTLNRCYNQLIDDGICKTCTEIIKDYINNNLFGDLLIDLMVIVVKNILVDHINT